MAQTEKQRIGMIGENEAERYLRKLGLSVIGRNYRKPWGEIDLIATKAGVLHFVEVKTVSREGGVIHETLDTYEPEDNIHFWKLKRLYRAINSYFLEHDLDEEELDWQLDTLAVYLEKESDKVLKIDHIEDVL